MSTRRERVAVLLSGGVDSAVALALLRDAGHRVTAYYLKIWLEEELAFLGTCPWEEDLAYARAVCRALKVPLEVVPFQAEYQQAVVEYVLGALRAGHTPSPDVLCNRAIKFGAFLEQVAGSADAVASGHYARLQVAADGWPRLRRGVDPVKDQSYFLAYLQPEQLARLRFPLGELHKHQVRALAEARALAPSQRPDSQGICFLGKLSYRDFVRAHLGERAGEIRELHSGEPLGSHRGHWFHTIGQRQGLGLGNGPWYVVTKDAAANVVYVAHDPAAAAPTAVLLTGCNWLDPETPAAGLHDTPLLVRIRHGDAPRPCRVSALPAAAAPPGTTTAPATPTAPAASACPTGPATTARPMPPAAPPGASPGARGAPATTNTPATPATPAVRAVRATPATTPPGNNGAPTRLQLTFDHPVAGIASGQFAVLYGGADGTLCLGAGVMERC